MKTIKGPAIFWPSLPVTRHPSIHSPPSPNGPPRWATRRSDPSWDARLFDLKKAAHSTTYCEEVKGTLAEHGLEITELSTHLQGQLVAVHPAYDIPASTALLQPRCAATRPCASSGRWSK